MKTCYLFLLLVFISCSREAFGSDVVTLTTSNFDESIQSGGWLVEFYAPWCGHCKKLAPVYEELATKMKDIDTKIHIAKVDCTVEKAIQERFKIKGYPTLKFIVDGKVYDFAGGDRQLSTLITFVEGGYLKGNPSALPEGAEEPAQATKVEPAKPAAQPAQPAAAAAATGGSDVIVLKDDTFDVVTQVGDWLLEFYAPWCGHCKSLAPTYEKLATSLKGKAFVAKIDCTSEEELRDRFNIRGFPTIKFLKAGKVYDYSGARTEEAFTAFVESGYVDATSNDVKRGPPPPPPAAEPANPTGGKTSDVVVLTDKSFDEQISKGSWLVEFYAPWCGHCKRLAPIFEAVATSVKGEINVGKVDCTVEKGKCGQHEIHGYPTVYYFRDGQRYKYQGDRSVAAFQEFVRTGWQSTSPEAMPGEEGILKKILIELVRGAEAILSVNIYLVIAGCVLVGLCLGVLIIVLAAPTNQPQQQQAKPTTTTATPTTDDTEEEDDDDHPKKE